MPESRIKRTKRNIFFSYLDTFITLLFAFISRTIIIHVFGDEYLGLSSLFTSILQVLSMAELGFSSAIVYNMYKPLAEGNTEKVCALLEYYRKIYRIIGVAIISIGTIVSPFLPVLIKGTVPVGINIYVLYFLYLINTGISYFAFAYKTALLDALQRLDLTKIIYSIIRILQYLLQIFVLLVLKNYYLYIAIMVLSTLAKNLLTGHIANKKFPQYQCKGLLDTDSKKDIISRVKGLLVSNVSMVTYTTLDSIIISSFIGLSAVAIYNNYLLVYTNITSFIVMIRTAMQASVGNSVATESKEKNYNDMILWQFLFAIIATWCVTCLFSLYQPFMMCWMGEDRLLPMRDVLIICLWFFFSVTAHSFYLYLSANGLWWEVRWTYILSTGCNLILNIALSQIIGITGIIFASFFSTFVFSLWQCKIIFKHYFARSIKEYLCKLLLYFITCCVSAGLAYLLNQYITGYSIPSLIGKFMVCSVVSVLVTFVIFRKTNMFISAKSFIFKVIKRSN